MMNVISLGALLVMSLASQAKPLPDFLEWFEETEYDTNSDETYEHGNPWEKSGEFEGDIILGVDDSIRNGLLNDGFYWPNKTLVYKIDSETFDDDQMFTITQAIGDFHKKTCIKMREKEPFDKDFVFITGRDASGCSSHVGRQGGKQPLYLKQSEPGKGCLKRGTIIHELLHALGFYHQQSAPERDEYVKILWENIQPGREHNFRKYNQDAVSNFNVTYDYHSIMHYSAYAFSSNEEKTIVPLDPEVKIGQRKTLSKKDVAKLHYMYKCKADSIEKPEEVTFGSAQGPDTDDSDDFETVLD